MGGRENSLRSFPLQYRPKHEDTVTAALERSYSISGQNGLLGRIAETLRSYRESAGGKRAVFRRGAKGADGFCQGKVCGKLRADCSAKSLPYQAEHKKEVTAAQLKQLWGYAEAFENATPAERRVIASALMEGVTVYPGYEPEIQFRGGVPE